MSAWLFEAYLLKEPGIAKWQDVMLSAPTNFSESLHGPQIIWTRETIPIPSTSQLLESERRTLHGSILFLRCVYIHPVLGCPWDVAICIDLVRQEPRALDSTETVPRPELLWPTEPELNDVSWHSMNFNACPTKRQIMANRCDQLHFASLAQSGSKRSKQSHSRRVVTWRFMK